MKRILSLTLAAATLLSLAWVAVPMVLIFPFRAQTPARVALSYGLRTRSGLLTTVMLLAGLVVVFLLWRRLTSWRGRVLAGIAVIALAGAAFVGRWNHFESMFHPLPLPGFAAADQVKDIEDQDLVLGVRVGDEARAYPVRAMAYHHLVNDLIANEPIVATY